MKYTHPGHHDCLKSGTAACRSPSWCSSSDPQLSWLTGLEANAAQRSISRRPAIPADKTMRYETRFARLLTTISSPGLQSA